MNRSLTALFAALEAVLVVGVGVGIPLIALTAMWASQYGFGVDWLVFWRAAVDSWLLGHGVDLQATLDAVLAASVGLPAGESAFAISIAPLGFALLTLLLAARAGRRVGETRYRNLGSIVAIGSFALISTLLTLSALHPLARPSIAQGMVLPTLVFALGFAVGLIRTSRHESDDNGSSLRDWVNDWPSSIRALAFTSLRGGAAVVAAIVAVSATLASLMLALNYARVIGLYEALHAGVTGGFALTIAQLAFFPNVVVWVASWLVGPGFAIGAGSSVSPLGSHLGPLPSVPFLGALPQNDLAFGFLGLVVPIAVGFVVAAMLRASLRSELDTESPLPWLLGTAAGIGAVAAVLMGVLAAASGGAAGPGRLAEVGPDPLAVAFWTFVEIALSAAIGFAASKPRIFDR